MKPRLRFTTIVSDKAAGESRSRPDDIPNRQTPSINDYNIGAKSGMAFASRNLFFKGKNMLCQRPAGSAAETTNGLRRGTPSATAGRRRDYAS